MKRFALLALIQLAFAQRDRCPFTNGSTSDSCPAGQEPDVPNDRDCQCVCSESCTAEQTQEADCSCTDPDPGCSVLNDCYPLADLTIEDNYQSVLDVATNTCICMPADEID